MAAGRMALVNVYDAVVNVIVADDNYEAPEGLLAFPLAADSPVTAGWTRDGGNWIGPATPDPGPSTPPATLEELVAQMQQVISGQQDQLALQQAQLDSLIDFIMFGGMG